MEQLHSRVGVEIELLTPRGTTRADLAGAVAGRVGGRVVPVFHRDSEPSAVPGMSSFRHLTRGFAVLDGDGAELCSVVDDITIVAGLDEAQLLDQADTLARAWGVPMYPAAKAVVAKADTTGTRIDPTDRRGADKLINRFQAAGYSEDYAKQLARAWNTDPRTAEIVGALVIDAGCCE
jgi:hypothetical protein